MSSQRNSRGGGAGSRQQDHRRRAGGRGRRGPRFTGARLGLGVLCILAALGLVYRSVLAGVFKEGAGIGMLGLIPAAWVVGAAAGESLDPRRMALASLAGLAVLYAVGMPYMALILNVYMGKGMTLSALLWAGMLPFLPGDALKILVTALLTPPIRRALDNSAK